MASHSLMGQKLRNRDYVFPVVIYCYLVLTTVPISLGSQEYSSSGTKASSIVFNNPKLLKTEVLDYDGYAMDGEQDLPDPKKLGGVLIENEAVILSSKLSKLANEELGVAKMQVIFDNLPYKEVQPNYEDELEKVASGIESKLRRYLTVLKTNKITVENLYRFHQRFPITHTYDCCSMPKSDLKYDPQYDCQVTRQTTCDLVPQRYVDIGAFNPGRNLTEVFQHISISSIKWQYFISADGIHNEFPAHDFGQSLPYSDCKNRHDNRHRQAYISTVYPQRKNVVILVDHGNSLSTNQLHTAKSIARYVLGTLNENDRVSIMGVSSEVTFPRDYGCLSSQLSPVTLEAQAYLTAFVAGLEKQDGASNHTLGFREAFRVIRNTLTDGGKKGQIDEHALILYVSRGLLSSLTEAKDVLTAIAEDNQRLGNRVIINTYAVIDDGKPIMYEKTFLQDVANQDYHKYGDELQPSSPPPPVGRMVSINTTSDLSITVGNYSDVFNWTVSTQPAISSPHDDQVGSGLVVSVTWPALLGGSRLLGVVGLDVHLGVLMEDVTYYSHSNAYMFAVDRKGYTLMHPSLTRPVMTTLQPMHTDIAHFEKVPSFETVRRQILRQKKGSATLEVTEPATENSTSANQVEQKVSRITYRWKRLNVKITSETLVEVSPYVIVVRIVEDGYKLRDIDEVKVPKSPELVYHRLDLLPTDHTCLHLKQLATTAHPAVFLAAGAFEQPFEHLSQDENKRMVQNYLAYLNDNTGLISNPGLKSDIRDDVIALSKISPSWLQNVALSQRNDHVIRRYVATPRGVMLMYPGTLLHQTYSPADREWFSRAQQFPGKITLTAPYLDVGGAGYIVTLSHTVYEGRPESHHSASSDRVEAVMGVDLTLGYFYRLLIEQLPVCEQKNIRCFIMDDRGYLIAHPGLIEANGHGPQEQEHVTRKEPLVANDILHHRGLVQKQLCNRYTDRTIQRFYQFNASITGVLTNLIHGEHFSRYQVTAIPGTNAFVGMVNETYNMMFCPCSMVDRLCLNCHRMEQTECECPCECPLQLDFCSGRLVDEDNTNPSCPGRSEPVRAAKPAADSSVEHQQCYLFRCERHKTKRTCLGVIDCEWCAMEADGTTPLADPFCGSQRTCFAGVLGAKTPYDDEKTLAAHTPGGDDPAIFKSTTPVGPVAGGIMVCFIVLALVWVYCYRNHMSHNRTNGYMNGANADTRGGDIDADEDVLDSSEEQQGPGHSNIVLASFENAASISPYRVNTQYRRAPNVESDLGYSTMTPHDNDSEQASTVIEPLIIGRDRYRPSSAASVVKPCSTTPILPPPPTTRGTTLQGPLLDLPSPRPIPEGGSGEGESQQQIPPQTQIGDPLGVVEGMTSLTSAIMQTPGSTMVPGQTVLPGDRLGVDSSGTAAAHQVIAAVQVHMVDTH